MSREQLARLLALQVVPRVSADLPQLLAPKLHVGVACGGVCLVLLQNPTWRWCLFHRTYNTNDLQMAFN